MIFYNKVLIPEKYIQKCRKIFVSGPSNFMTFLIPTSYSLFPSNDQSNNNFRIIVLFIGTAAVFGYFCVFKNFKNTIHV